MMCETPLFPIQDWHRYAKGYAELEALVPVYRDPIRLANKRFIMTNIVNYALGDTETKPTDWEDIRTIFALLPLQNKGQVISSMTALVVPGERKIIEITRPRKAAIVFHAMDGLCTKLLASPSAGPHWYVKAEDGKIWCPVSGVWGTMDEQQYLSRIGSE